MTTHNDDIDLFGDGTLAVQIPAAPVPDLPEPVLLHDGPMGASA